MHVGERACLFVCSLQQQFAYQAVFSVLAKSLVAKKIGNVAWLRERAFNPMQPDGETVAKKIACRDRAFVEPDALKRDVRRRESFVISFGSQILHRHRELILEPCDTYGRAWHTKPLRNEAHCVRRSEVTFRQPEDRIRTGNAFHAAAASNIVWQWLPHFFNDKIFRLAKIGADHT